MKHPIPDAALDDRLAFVGTSGSDHPGPRAGAADPKAGAHASSSTSRRHV